MHQKTNKNAIILFVGRNLYDNFITLWPNPIEIFAQLTNIRRRRETQNLLCGLNRTHFSTKL